MDCPKVRWPQLLKRGRCEPSLELLKFLPAFPGDALEVGTVFVGESAGDGVAVAVLGFVMGGLFLAADVGDGVDGEADGALIEKCGIQSAGGEVGHGLIEVRVVDKAQGEIWPLGLAAEGDEGHGRNGGVDLFCQGGDGALFLEDGGGIGRGGEGLFILGLGCGLVEDDAGALGLGEGGELGGVFGVEGGIALGVVAVGLEDDDVPGLAVGFEFGKHLGMAFEGAFGVFVLGILRVFFECGDGGLFLGFGEGGLLDNVLCAEAPVVFEGAAAVDDIGAIEGEARVARLRHGLHHSGEIVTCGEAVADEEDVERFRFAGRACRHGK